MQEFVLTIAKKDVEALTAIRCVNGLMAADDNTDIWIRGQQGIDTLEKAIRHLPVRQRFYLDENELLFPAGTITPVGKLAVMNWLPVAELIPVEMPVSTGVGEIPPPVKIRLQPSAVIHKSTALLTDLKTWKAYIETASVIRLNGLKFAVSENNTVMVLGDILPSIPGREYWSCNGMLLPAGYEFEMPVIAAFLPRKLDNTKDLLIVFHETGEWYKIDLNFFIPVTRSAVRMTNMNVEE